MPHRVETRESKPVNEVLTEPRGSTDPTAKLGFEISPNEKRWTFIPEFYPESFTQMKKKKLSRYGSGCGGETVTIKQTKNKEFHVNGVLLQGELGVFRNLMEHHKPVDIISPLVEFGGKECYVKKAEIGEKTGWEPHHRQWLFEYTIDLVSTGEDGEEGGRNGIVSAILRE